MSNVEPLHKDLATTAASSPAHELDPMALIEGLFNAMYLLRGVEALIAEGMEDEVGFSDGRKDDPDAFTSRGHELKALVGMARGAVEGTARTLSSVPIGVYARKGGAA